MQTSSRTLSIRIRKDKDNNDGKKQVQKYLQFLNLYTVVSTMGCVSTHWSWRVFHQILLISLYGDVLTDIFSPFQISLQ